MKTYRINEIFYSLQGEGRWTGRPAVFVRMSGCNLSCPFCDTDFTHYKEMTAQDIVEQCLRTGNECRFIVLTGGEPSLQADDALIEAWHQAGYYVAVETNGTHLLPQGIDWITLFAKEGPCGDSGGCRHPSCQRTETRFRRQASCGLLPSEGRLPVSAALRHRQR